MTDSAQLPSSRRTLLQDLASAALAQRGAERGAPGTEATPDPEVRDTMLKLRKLLAVRGG